MRKLFYLIPLAAVINLSCNKDEEEQYTAIVDPYESIKAAFGNTIDPGNLANYASQAIPAYVVLDNSGPNPVTNEGATLGRVLFYDKNMSVNNTVACSGCHMQANAFSDAGLASNGVNGTTARHSMRLVNIRFSEETKFFWNERALTLEMQTTMPVKDHGEMGFSGENGDASFDDLIVKLNGIGYYRELFKLVYGTEEITEQKIQLAMAQFIRSIQSFDSKYDAARAVAPGDGPPFPAFTMQENQGKNLFLTPPAFNANGVRTGGGVGCAGCHRPPNFDIDPASKNNGLITILNGTGTDTGNTRAPSLRDLVRPDGALNGPLMHTGEFESLNAVLDHYNSITVAGNDNLDQRLMPAGAGQQLNLTATEANALIAFLKTLSGNNIYTDVKWSDPFLH